MQVRTEHRVFSLMRPASMQIYWNKRKRLHKKRVHSHRIGLGHQHDGRCKGVNTFLLLGLKSISIS